MPLPLLFIGIAAATGGLGIGKGVKAGIDNAEADRINKEATSSVDTITEKKIQQAIRAVIKGRTSFVIAHRLSTIVDADIILVVHDGKIVEKGTHAQLMKQKGEYFQLYTRQYEDWMEV